jgi:hypothetical protein
MNKQLSYLLQHRVKRKKGDTTRLAAQLAPLEEQKGQNALQHVDSGHGAIQGGATQEYGAIVVDNESVRLSNEMMEGKARGGFLGMEPVVIAILAFMLTFIAFIAWQISRMPLQ